MKVSTQWMKDFGGQGLDVPTDKLVETIGAQLGAVEETTDLSTHYKGILVAKVVDCVDHPNADRLHVCKIDDGHKADDVERDDNGYVQVVCGAPNVREGLLVAWIPPGAVVPSSVETSEPFVLEARDLRGQKSNGMLASQKELAIGDSHEGILVIDEPAKPGDSFASIYKLNDQIIDIENKMFTHRPDCFGMLGVAREIAGISGQAFTSPAWYLNKPQLPVSGESLKLEVVNEVPELVPRFMALAIANVEIKPSPIWLQSFLSRVGVRPINNVVDATNYIMLLTAQPMHAYDYDKVRAQDKGCDHATILARRPLPDEKLELLNGKEISFGGQEIIIASASKPIGLGGVMGGASTEVDNQTKNIILECATFDMYNIRRTSMAHGIFSDAVTRFNKGQSPLQNDRVIVKCAELIKAIAGESAGYASELIDLNNVTTVTKPVVLSADFVNARLGLSLSIAIMKQLLQNVEFVVEEKDNNLSVTAPFWRTDIEIPEDVVEEIGRLYGYDQLPLVLPTRSLKPASKNTMISLKSRLSDRLAAGGANEVLTYSFVHGKLLSSVGQDSEKAFELNNALSPELQFYRVSLTPSLLEKVYPNLRSDYVRGEDNEFVLFEINKTHNKGDKDEEKLPKEWQSLALLFAADAKTAARKYQGAAYYGAKRYLSFLLQESQLNLKLVPLKDIKKADLESSTWVSQLVKPFEPGRSAVLIDELNKIRGIVGEYTAAVRQALKLPDFASGFELDISVFEDQLPGSGYIALPRFPKVEQDVTLRVPKTLEYAELFDFIWDKLDSDKPKDTFFTLVPLGIYQKDEDPKHKKVSFRLWISAYDRTLTSDVVNELLDQVSKKAEKEFGAERV